MTNEQNNMQRMTIRVAEGSLAFAQPNALSPSQIDFETYVTKGGVSMPANLREAFKTSEMLQRPTNKARVLIDSQPLLIPIEEYKESDNETLYMHSFPATEGVTVMSNILPSLNAVALFSVNSDLQLVFRDHYRDVKYTLLMRPVWDYMLRRSLVGNNRKLYAYSHDSVLELFSFERSRFIFCNRYLTRNTKDMVYFMLFVWKQLALDQMRDELFLAGDMPERDSLITTLRKYISTVHFLSPSACFNRAPMTQIKGITFDMITSFMG